MLFKFSYHRSIYAACLLMNYYFCYYFVCVLASLCNNAKALRFAVGFSLDQHLYDAALWGDLLQQMLNLAMVSVSVLVRVCKEFQDPRKMCYCKLYSKAEYYNEKRLFGEERFLKKVLSVMVTGLHPPPRHIAVFMRLAQTMLLISP